MPGREELEKINLNSSFKKTRWEGKKEGLEGEIPSVICVTVLIMEKGWARQNK